MTTTKDLLSTIEAMRDRKIFMAMNLETKLRNTCPGCGCRLCGDDFARALSLVTGPPKTGQCGMCGWVGTK
jgi:hypothetical protein